MLHVWAHNTWASSAQWKVNALWPLLHFTDATCKTYLIELVHLLAVVWCIATWIFASVTYSVCSNNQSMCLFNEILKVANLRCADSNHLWSSLTRMWSCLTLQKWWRKWQEVVVIDGKIKNRCDVCVAKDAGCIQYPGLPGHIKSGCTASPQFKSQYCQEHDNRSCIPPCTDEDDPIAEMILEKKTTRSNTFYKVCGYKVMYISSI